MPFDDFHSVLTLPTLAAGGFSVVWSAVQCDKVPVRPFKCVNVFRQVCFCCMLHQSLHGTDRLYFKERDAPSLFFCLFLLLFLLSFSQRPGYFFISHNETLAEKNKILLIESTRHFYL